MKSERNPVKLQHNAKDVDLIKVFQNLLLRTL